MIVLQTLGYFGERVVGDFLIGSGRNLKPPAKGQRTVRDTVVQGFAVRVSQGGTKTFIVIYGKQRKQITLGRYPLLSLAEARQKAKEVLYQVTVYGASGPRVTWDEAVGSFLSVRKPELRERTWDGYKRLLEGKFDFTGAYLEDIETADVINALDVIKGQSQKAHAYTAIKVFFNWCIERKYLRRNPLGGIKKPRVATNKDRVLDDDELTAVWWACEKLGRFGNIVRLLIVTGQRCNQISRLQERWVDFDKKKIVFPAEVMKNGLEHEIPLCQLSEYVLRCQLPYEGYYFSPVGFAGQPFSAWSKSKRALDELVKIDPWTLHDLRRTWATNAARLDIAPHITDRVLSHQTGSIGAVARIYNRWKYQAELKEAMDKMNNHLLELLEETHHRGVPHQLYVMDRFGY